MLMSTDRSRSARARTGQSTEVSIADMTMHLTVTELQQGRPGEIFIRAGKQGSTFAGLCESLAMTLSLALQHGVPLDDVVTRLQGMHYPPSGLTTDPDIPRVSSLSDYIARRLTADYLSTGDRTLPGTTSEVDLTTGTVPNRHQESQTA
jgi:ribonucleoside-diphosphate reductase alpha chain